MNLRIYLAGRRPLAAAAVWLVCAACGFFFWRSGMETYLLGQTNPRVVPAIEVVTVVGAALCASLMSSRLPVADRLSVRPLGTYASQAAVVTIAVFGVIPLIPLAWLRLLPGWFPPGTFIDTSDEIVPPVEVYTVSFVGVLAMTCVFFAATSVLCVVLAGRVLGVLAAFATYLLVVLVQSTDYYYLVPLTGGGRDPYAFQPASVMWAAVATLLAALAWAKLRGIPYPDQKS